MPKPHIISEWQEETYRAEDDLNHQAYSTCNMEQADIANWLLLPRIDRHGANRLSVETKFTMRKCVDVPSARDSCKETLQLYASQVSENRQLADRWWIDAQWELVDTIAPNTKCDEHADVQGLQFDPAYVQSSSFPVNSSSVYFALKDSGACTSILYVKIYHMATDQVEAPNVPNTTEISSGFECADAKLETKLRLTKITLHLTRDQKLEFISDDEYQAFKVRNPEFFN